MSAPLARREIRARPGRFAWLIVAVTVAVGFTVGAFGFSTQLTKLLDPATTETALDSLPEGSVVLTADTDSVTSATALDDRLLDTVRAVPGVAIAEGSYDQPISFRVAAQDQPERPTILRGVVLSSTYSPEKWTIVDGRSPEGPDEVAVDGAGLIVGRTALGADARLEFPTGVRTVRVVGVVQAAGARAVSSAGANPIVALASAHAVLDPVVAPILLDAAGRVDRITIAPLPGVDPGDLEDRLRETLPPGVIVSSSLSRIATTQHTVERIDDGVQQAVAGFAGLTVLISSLVVANTLSVLVAQRTREFGLLRLVGASRARILRMVMGESLGVGVIGAALGLGLGVVLAYLAARVVRTTTVPVGFEATPSMAVVAVVVGVLVTLVGGVVPAMRAGRVPPLAALSDTRTGGDRRPRVLLPLVAALGGAGLAAVMVARVDGAVGQRVAIAGAVVAFVGIAGLSRWVVGPLLAPVGLGLRLAGGAAGRLGVGNARRQPSRTAGAASTLMVSLALVAFVATIGASVRTTVRSQFDTASRADLYIERRGVVRVSTNAIEASLARRLRGVRAFASIVAVDGVLVGRNGATAPASASVLDQLDRLVDLGVTTGAVPRGGAGETVVSGTGEVVLSESVADELGVAVDDAVTLRSISGIETPLHVAATYTNTAIAGEAVVDLVGGIEPSSLGTFELGLVQFDGRVRQRAVTEVAGRFPKVRVHTPGEFGELNASVTDLVLRIIGVVLAGMVGIGYLGLVATLGLSTLERRKELVMLRAVGAARAQVRTMVWVEATLIACIAAIVGLSLGVLAGWAGGHAAPEDLVGRVVIPWQQLAAVAAVSVVLAWVVSLGVSRRASYVPPAEAGR